MEKNCLDCGKTPIRPDLRCENCFEQESTTLLYYERYHVESGRTSLINPSLICDKCKKLFLGNNALYSDVPRLLAFTVIAKWDARMMGLTSKRYDFSVFRNPYFKKKIWRIHYASQPEKNATQTT